MANKPIKTTGEVIEVLGGTTAVSQLIDTTYSCCRQLAIGREIPGTHLPDFATGAAPEKRTASDDLWTMGRRAARN